MSLLASAKAHEVEPWVYLRDLIDHPSQTNDKPHPKPNPAPLNEWFPDAYLANNPTAYRKRFR